MTGDRCPTCKQSVPLAAPVRVCSLCKQQIVRHDKWCFGKDGRVRHRHCDNPDDYFPARVRQQYNALRGAGRDDAAWQVLVRYKEKEKAS